MQVGEGAQCCIRVTMWVRERAREVQHREGGREAPWGKLGFHPLGKVSFGGMFS